MWKTLMNAAKKNGLAVVGVSFHVGSGCRDVTRYELALKDAKEVFEMGKEMGFNMHILDIGGGFPGETHSMWNPADEIEGSTTGSEDGNNDNNHDREGESPEAPEALTYFRTIAETVAPLVDELFPSPDVRVIAEPGRYFSAAAATLCCSVIAVRTNQMDENFEPEPIDDRETALQLEKLTRDEEAELIEDSSKYFEKSTSIGGQDADNILSNLLDDLQSYSRLYARQQLTQQEADGYNDTMNLYEETFDTAADILGAPEKDQLINKSHTVEGMNYSLVAPEAEPDAMMTLAAAGEAAVSGIVMQAVADSPALKDDYSYYINDGVYGAFNNVIFDHATVRIRVLRGDAGRFTTKKTKEGFQMITMTDEHKDANETQALYPSTVFGPTCDR
jgi:hypothetical protein